MAEDSFSLEKNLQQIRALLDRLQKETLSFDEHLALMQEGMERIKSCHDYLDQAELKIQQLQSGEWNEFPSDPTED